VPFRRTFRRVMQCGLTRAWSLPDAENKQLRLYALDFPEGKGFLQEELVYSMEGTPSGTHSNHEAADAPEPLHRLAQLPNSVQAAVREGFEVVLLFTVDQPESAPLAPWCSPAPRRWRSVRMISVSSARLQTRLLSRRECACLPRDSVAQRAALQRKAVFGR